MSCEEKQTKAPLRVLHVLATLNRGGAESLVVNLYRTIDRTQIQFDFVVHYKTSGGFVEEVKRLGGRIFVCPSFTAKNILPYILWWNHLFKEHKDIKIIHSHIRSTASLYLPIARHYGLKTIIHSHSTNNGTGISAIVKWLLQYPLKLVSDYYCACS